MIMNLYRVERGSILLSITKLHKGEFVSKEMNFRHSDSFVKKFEIFKKLNFIDFEKDKKWKNGDMDNRLWDRNYFTSRGDRVVLMSFYHLRYLKNNFKVTEEVTLKEFWNLLHSYHDEWFHTKRYENKIKVRNPILRINKTYIIVEEKNESI